MGRLQDLTGQKFGRLIVIKRVENSKSGGTRWLCKCECGNTKEVQGGNLKNGSVTTCRNCPTNTWEFKDDYIIGYTRKGQKFLIDTEDYEEVSKYNWYMDTDGYIISHNVNGKSVKLHRFIMKVKNKNVFVDHIHQKVYDNRKSKLRICTSQNNTRNRKDVRGYYWEKCRSKYSARIMVGYKSVYIGLFDTEDEARFAYCSKAIELFGDFVHEDVVKDYERLKEKLQK